jgi:hypothetical protein
MVKYPIYIVSKGRADNGTTARFLLKENVSFKIVVEPQETTAYENSFGKENVLTLPFSNLGKGSYPARNWIWEHSKAAGDERHWILDDNIQGVRRLFAGERLPADSGPAFRSVETLTDRYSNVAISGMNYRFFVTAISKPFAVNVHVYSCLLIKNDLPHRWRLRYNEDTDLCLQVLMDGYCTILTNTFMIDKAKTMTMKGGNTDELYVGDGRLRMARSLEAVWPGIVATKLRYGRPQHVVHWGQFKTRLPLREGVDLSAMSEREEHGVKLIAVKPVESPKLKRLIKLYDADKEEL